MVRGVDVDVSVSLETSRKNQGINAEEMNYSKNNNILFSSRSILMKTKVFGHALSGRTYSTSFDGA